jgi:N-acetylneuraminic acid mutarotase
VTDVLSSADGLNWSLVGNLPVGLNDGSVLILNNVFWYFGGNTTGFVTVNTVAASFDFGATWTAQTNLPNVREGAAGMLYNNKMWLVAGTDSNDSAVPRQDAIWTTNDSSWTIATAAIPSPLDHPGSTVFNNKMWLLGGATAGNFGAVTSEVRSSTDGVTWTLVGNLPAAILAGSAAVFQNKMWLIGGQVGGGPVNTTYFSTDGAAWSAGPNLPAAIIDPGVVVYQNKLWVIGGETNIITGTALSEVWNTSDGLSWNVVGTTSFNFSYLHQALFVY